MPVNRWRFYWAEGVGA